MNEEKRKNCKETFKRYMRAEKETKECKDPCLKNGKSDRYCLDCANEIIEPLLKNRNNGK